MSRHQAELHAHGLPAQDSYVLCVLVDVTADRFLKLHRPHSVRMYLQTLLRNSAPPRAGRSLQCGQRLDIQPAPLKS